MGGKVKKDKCIVKIQKGSPTKEAIRELRGLYDEVNTSDLQGIIMAKAIRMNIPNEKRNEAEDVMIQFARVDMDINSAKRFLDDMK